MEKEKRFVSIRSAATELGIAEIRVWELIRHGVIGTESIRRSLYVELSELAGYLEAHSARYNLWKQNYRHAQTCKLLFFN